VVNASVEMYDAVLRVFGVYRVDMEMIAVHGLR
jgi:hypothetical protein